MTVEVERQTTEPPVERSAPSRPPRDDLIRAMSPGPELRDSESGLGTLHGDFATFNEWTEINSIFEGRFMESIQPGAFRKAISDGAKGLQVLYDHGQDQHIGSKPLGPKPVLGESDHAAYYETPLLDTSYNRDLAPGLKAGVYGSSFRFSVVKEDFVARPKRSSFNPEQLPERTIQEARLYDVGPTPFPAYISTSAGMRSMTDEFMVRKLKDNPKRTTALIEAISERSIASDDPEAVAPALPADGADASHSDEGSRSEQESPLKDITAAGQKVAAAVAEGLRSAQPDPPPAVADPSPEDPPTSGSSVTERKSVNTIEERRSRLDEITARSQEIHAEFGVDVLPEAIQAEWDTLQEERATHEKAIKAYEDRSAALVTAATSERNVERVGEPTQTRTSTASRVPNNVYALEEYRNLSNSPEQEQAAIRSGALKALEASSFPHERADEAKNKDNISKLLKNDEGGVLSRHILATGNPIYQRAFVKMLAGRMLSSEEQRAIMTVGTTTTGGFAIPYTFDPTLILTSDGNVNPLRQMARVERITGAGNTWKGVSTAGITITRGPAEMQPVTPTEVTLAQPEVTVQPVKVEIQFSIEADEDWPGLQTQLARVLQDAKDDEEADSFVNGVGTTVFPAGVVETLDASSEVGTTGNGLDVADLYRLEGALGARYTARAEFLAHRAVYAAIRQFSVGTTGEGSVWARGLAAGDPPQLLGYPARQISTMETDYTTDGNRVLLFGDFNNFLIVDKVGMTIEIDPHVRNGDGKWVGARALLAHYRNSSVILNHAAFRVLVVGVVTS